MNSRSIHRARLGAALLCAVAGVPGCASLDPAEDVARSSSLVETRAQTDTGWTAAWDERPGVWDGRAPLSSDTVVRIALQNNRDIRRRVETITASRAEYVQAHLLPNPVLRLAVGFPTDGLGGTPLLATLVQQLTWLWRRPTAIDAAEADLQRQVLAVSDAALTLVADVRRAHADVVFAERAVRLQRESIELIEHSASLLRDRFEVGEASRLDVNRFELDLLRAEAQLADRTAELERTKRDLLERLGRAGDGVDWRTDDVVPDAVVAEGLDETQLIMLASTQRLDVAAAQAACEGRAARLELARLGRLPDVGVGVGYQQNYQDRPGVFPAVTLTPKILDDNGARVALAASELRQTEIEADRVQQAAIAEVRRAWVDLRAQLAIMRAYEQDIVLLAEQNFRLAGGAFDAGETDLTVLLEAQRELNQARLELTDRQRAATAHLLELERAAGGSLAPQPVLGPAFAAATIVPPGLGGIGEEVSP